MIFNKWSKTIQNIIFAPQCALCNAQATLQFDLCPRCRADLPWLDRACRHCALALPAGSDGTRCRQCAHKPLFDAAVAAFEYAAPVDWMITRLKFHSRFSHARLLASLLVGRVVADPAPRPDCLVPVPLHVTRYRERGYNQATLLARHMARPLGLPVLGNLAVRTHATDPQLSLPAPKRRSNVRRAFDASAASAGRHIAIVDDVVTTGYTARALAAAFRRSGAASVQLWCVARA